MTSKYNILYLFCLIFSFSVLSCSEDKTIVVEAEPKSDSNVTGTITFSEDGDQVLMNAVFAGLTPGSHAIHLHEFSDCSSPDGKSTGGHWNPTFEDHGAWGNETGFHRGDIGNFEANENGEARYVRFWAVQLLRGQQVSLVLLPTSESDDIDRITRARLQI